MHARGDRIALARALGRHDLLVPVRHSILLHRNLPPSSVSGGERRPISALAGSSKVPRVLSPPGGVTGDPWAPLRSDKDGSLKVLTVSGQGFDYRRMVELMFPTEGRPSPLQAVVSTDPPEGLALLARALVRGQGKTEGYHERLVPLSNSVRSGPARTPTDPIAMAAHSRVAEAGKVKREVFNPALYALFQNGPDRIDLRHRDSERKAASFLAAFDREVDRIFFARLWDEADAEESKARSAQRDAWMHELLELAKLSFSGPTPRRPRHPIAPGRPDPLPWTSCAVVPRRFAPGLRRDPHVDA